MLATQSYRNMKRLYEEFGADYLNELDAATAPDGKGKAELSYRDFSLRQLTEALVPNGREFLDLINPAVSLNFQEAAEVNTSALGIIASNLVMQRIQESYEEPEYVLSRMIPTETGRPFEVTPKIVPLGDDAGVVPEGEDYPNAVISSDWTMAPGSTKEGTIVPITREALYEDRTGQVMSFASDVGRTLALRKELRLIDTLIGYTKQRGGYGVNYNWAGTEYPPWQLSTPWINRIASNELVDHTDMEGIQNLFTNMRDPNTGLPIVIGGKQVLVMPQKVFAASRLFQAQEVTYSTPSGTDQTVFTKVPNPLQGYSYNSSALLYDRILTGGNNGAAPSSPANAQTYYYVGDFPRALCWWEQFPLKLESRGMEAEAAFRRDVVMQFKASQRGTGRWKDPRYVVHSYLAL